VKDAALKYLDYGWSVIPIRPCHKEPLIPWALYQRRKPREKKVRWWFEQWPDANVGVVTGVVSGIIALDVDPGADLSGKHIPITPRVKTGRGEHFIFKHPGFDVPNAVKIAPGLDVRGDGGYIVAPPSTHPNGKQYEWIVSPEEVEPADPPEWLLDLLHNLKRPKDWTKIAQGVSEGERNETAARYAGKLLSSHPEHEWEAIVWPALQAWNERNRPPLPESELRQVFESICKREAAKRRDLESRARELHLTDAGNGELIALMVGDRLRYDHKRGSWLLWDGVRWKPDADGEVDRIALEAARLRLQSAIGIEDKDRRAKSVSWALGSENSPRRRAALDSAKSLPPIADAGKCWDSDPWLLGVPNGIVDLRTGELIEPKPEHRITMQAGSPYQPESDCPRWKRFLEEIFQGDRGLIDFVHRAVGYSLTGSAREQCLFICFGTGANGKTTFLNILRLVLGDYAANTPFQTFEDIRTQTASNDVAALMGKRLVTSSETRERTRLNEARVKALTGGDPVTARFLYGEYFTFTPRFKLWLAVNHKPRISDDSEGFWRRVRLIPFQAQFIGDQADPDLLDTLKAETSGVLGWAVQGCLLWQELGLKVPECVVEATREYREEQDVIGQFIEECCVISENAQARAGELWTTFKEWTSENGFHQGTSTAFGRKLSERGFRKSRDGKGFIYQGIGVKSDSESEFT
jgi:putative DNA primase/helicase